MPFHICRTLEKLLPIGQLDLLAKWPTNDANQETINLISEGLEAGLSRHGQRYMSDKQNEFSVSSTAIELLFEQVRQRFYPHRPSRMQSFFAVPDEASLLKIKLPSPVPFHIAYEVSEVIPDSSFTANMNLLHIENPGGFSIAYAHAYWRGEQGPADPMWEILIPHSVNIIRQLPPVMLPQTNLQAPEPSSALETQ